MNCLQRNFLLRQFDRTPAAGAKGQGAGSVWMKADLLFAVLATGMEVFDFFLAPKPADDVLDYHDRVPRFFLSPQY